MPDATRPQTPRPAERHLRVAALQLQTQLGDIAANLEHAEQVATTAGDSGAEWIVLPEFFATGMGFSPALRDRAQGVDGPAAALLSRLARRYHAKVGGSFLCRDPDGETRNAFLLMGPDGLLARHNKDEPTLWENCWYTGGDDDGRFEIDGLRVGVVLCAEFGRAATVKRLAQVDLVVGGSLTWHAPEYIPLWLGRGAIERRLFTGISAWAAPFARMVGAPVVEATHCGQLVCRDQLLPLEYRSPIGDGAKICAADGTLLAARTPGEGPGVVQASVVVGAVPPVEPTPSTEWVRPLGPLGSVFWNLQRAHGRSWYQKHVREHP
jgi:hypothetical protein